MRKRQKIVSAGFCSVFTRLYGNIKLPHNANKGAIFLRLFAWVGQSGCWERANFSQPKIRQFGEFWAKINKSTQGVSMYSYKTY